MYLTFYHPNWRHTCHQSSGTQLYRPKHGNTQSAPGYRYFILYLSFRFLLIPHLQITRALLVRSHPSAHTFIDHFCELLDDSTVDWDAARALGLLANEDAVLTKRNGAVLKVCRGTLLHGVYLDRDCISRFYTCRNISMQ